MDKTVKISKSFERVLQSWSYSLEQARYKGQGRYAWCFAKDLADYFKILDCLQDENFKKAWQIYYSLDTDVAEMIPMKIVNFLYKEYYDV